MKLSETRFKYVYLKSLNTLGYFLLALFSLLLFGCQPAATPTPLESTQTPAPSPTPPPPPPSPSPTTTATMQILSQESWSNITWHDPYPGDWTTIDVTTEGILPNSEDVASKLEKLIEDDDKFSGPTILYFPPGTYNFNEGKVSIKRNDLIILGDDQNQTVFKLNNDVGSISFLGWDSRVNKRIVEDVDPGTNTITLDDTEDLEVGDVVKIDQELVDYGSENKEWGRRSWGGVFLITDVDQNKNTITTNLPLALGLIVQKNPEVHQLRPIRNIGVQNIKFERTTPSGGSTLFFKKVYNAFVKNVESVNTAKHHVHIVSSHRVIVEDSFFDDAWNKGTGGNGYGVNIEDVSTQVMVTNNVIKNMRHHLLISMGSHYNVFSYNYNVDTVRDTCFVQNPSYCDDYNGWMKANNVWREADVSIHGHFPHHTLFEGNVFYYAEVDYVHGQNGPGNIFFRNKFRGQPDPYGGWREGEAFYVVGPSHGQVVVGNVFLNGAKLTVDNSRGQIENIFVEGNTFDGVVEWTDVSTDDRLPASLYTTQKPDFWPDNLPWPAFGPDIPASNVNKIPAQLRYEGMAQ